MVIFGGIPMHPTCLTSTKVLGQTPTYTAMQPYTTAAREDMGFLIQARHIKRVTCMAITVMQLITLLFS